MVKQKLRLSYIYREKIDNSKKQVLCWTCLGAAFVAVISSPARHMKKDPNGECENFRT